MSWHVLGRLPFSIKIAPSHSDLDPAHLTRLLASTPVSKLILNGITTGSSVFAGLTVVTDRETDKPRYSPGILLGLCGLKIPNISDIKIQTHGRRNFS